MNSRPNCQARIIGDEYHCERCGLFWGIKDLDPPDCQTVFNVGTPGHVDHGKPESDPEIEKTEMEKMRAVLKPDRCQHGVPENSECRSCNLLNYKRRVKND